MKYILLSASALMFLMSSCGNSSQSGDKDKDIKEVKIQVVKEFALVSTNSRADWSRYLDQKPTKQNVQLFGATMEVDLGQVQMTTSGTASISGGNLLITNDTLTKGQVIFDMASFKLAKEKGNGLFDVVSYPNSELNMLEFIGPDSAMTIKAELTIQQTTKPIDIKAKLERKGEVYSFNGNFSFNTLDFPLRDKVKASDVNQDVITIGFVVQYKQSSMKRDTIR